MGWIKLEAAVSILAGKPLKRRTAAAQYGRLAQRLKRAVGRREVAMRPQGRLRLYREADVRQLAADLAEFGVTPHASRAQAARARRARVKREFGLIGVDEAAKRRSVAPGTMRDYARAGRPGAVQIDGEWYFDPEKLLPRIADREPSVTLICTQCGCEHTRTASRARATEHPFCSRECLKEHARTAAKKNKVWPVGHRASDTDATREKKSQAMHRRWDNGEMEDVRPLIAALGNPATCEEVSGKVHVTRSPKAWPDKVAKYTQTRYGRDLDEEERRKLKSSATSSATKDAHKAAGEQLDKLIAWLWPRLTVPKISEWTGKSDSTVRLRASKMGLPPKSPGRPPKPSDNHPAAAP